MHVEGAGDRIQPLDLRDQQPVSAQHTQPVEIDGDVIEVIASGDVTGHHPGVDRGSGAGNKRHPKTRDRAHGEATQHLHVGVPATGENKIMNNGLKRLQRLGYFGSNWLPGSFALQRNNGGRRKAHRMPATR